MNGGIIKHSDAIKFIFAGNCVVTFINTLTSNRFTFKVKRHKTDNVYFISLLTNTDNYSFIGRIIDNTYVHGRNSTISIDSQSVKTFNYVIQCLRKDKLQDFIEIWHQGTCGKCGRKLTVPESISSGLGPECIKKLKKQLLELC